jgi:signal transduction histidine kinase
VPRPTIRLRLTLLYGGLFLAAGIVLLAGTHLLLRQRLDEAHPSGLERVERAFGPPDRHPGAFAGSLQVHTLDGRSIPQFLEDENEQIKQSILDEQLFQSVVALAITASGSVFLGWVVAGRALRPVHHITETARQASERSLGARVALAGPDDELKELGDTFDAMLDRLEVAFESQRTFAANASHELRTPVAILHAEADVRLAEPGLSDSEQEFARRVQTAALRSERVIDALLALSRSQSSMIERVAIDLAELAGDVAGDLAPAADARGIDLDVTLDTAEVAGDRSLLERLIANLVDNAIRHNFEGGWLRLVVGAAPGVATITVENTGPELSGEEVGHLFEPFHRSRNGSPDGHGLGMAIVRSVAAAHGGAARAAPREGGGLMVTVQLPLAGERLRL